MLTGRETAAGPVVARLEQRIEAVKTAVAPFGRPRVLYVLWPEPLIVPGREALVTELIHLAGGQSLTADDADAWPRYSLEAAVAKSPEVILLANHGAGTGAVSIEKWQRLTSLPAVKSGRLLSVSGDLMHRYGPRFVDGLEQLARAIHPEAFR
jgi:iron complex transport system substrate-binding protein